LPFDELSGHTRSRRNWIKLHRSDGAYGAGRDESCTYELCRDAGWSHHHP
jgi:hypothetical protein